MSKTNKTKSSFAVGSLKIRTRISIGFAIIAILVGVVGHMSATSLKNVSTITNELNGNVTPRAISAVEMINYTNEIHLCLMEYIVKGEYADRKEIQKSIYSFRRSVEDYKEHRTHIDVRDQEDMEELEARIEKFISTVNDFVNLKDRGMSMEMLLLKEKESKLHSETQILIQHLEERKAMHIQEMFEAHLDIAQTEIEARQTIVGLIFILIILTIIISILISNSITKSIKNLFKGIKIIEKGNLDYKIGIRTRDEVGQLSQAFDKMTNSLKKSRNDVEEKVIQRTADLEEINRRMVGRELKMIELKKEIKELKSELKHKSKI